MTGTAAAAAALARILGPGQDVPVERGAGAVFEAISGQQLRADVRWAAGHELTGDERELLQPGDRDSACCRSGRLHTAGGVPVADVTAVLLPRRVPVAARAALGISPTGSAREGRLFVPLGRALRGLGVRRQQLGADPADGPGAGDGTVLCSRALLLVSSPIALVTERVCLAFLEAFPLPWPAAEVFGPAIALPGAPGRQFAPARDRDAGARSGSRP